MKAVELAKASGINKLVVWRYDRLGRDSAEYLPLVKWLKRLGVDVVSVTQPTEGMFMMGILGLMAEEESRRLSVRVTASKQRRFQEGKWGGGAPFGYDTKHDPEGGSILVPNQDAPLVTEMFHRYASGKNSINDLRRYLNECGHVRSRYSIWYILKNEVYAGLVKHGKFSRSQFMAKPSITTAQGRHEPLVDQQTFNRVQDRLSANKNRQRGSTAPRYLFSGLLYCAHCGRKFVGRTSSKRKGQSWVEYHCGRKLDFKDCPSHSIFDTRLRAEVIPPIKELIARLGQQDVREAVYAELTQRQEGVQASASQSRRTLEETMEKLEARLSRLEDSYLDKDLSRDRYLTRRDEILDQLEEIKGQLAERPTSIAPDLKQLFAIADAITVETLDDEAWRDIVEEMIDRIIIAGTGDGRKSPSIIKVVWKPAYEPLFTMVTERQ
jgi:site-specific DNA recombinase